MTMGMNDLGWKRSKYLSAWAHQFTTGRSPSNLEASAKMYVDVLEAQLAAMRHDLMTAEGLYAVDHELPNEPDAFRLEFESIHEDDAR